MGIVVFLSVSAAFAALCLLPLRLGVLIRSKRPLAIGLEIGLIRFAATVALENRADGPILIVSTPTRRREWAVIPLVKKALSARKKKKAPPAWLKRHIRIDRLDISLPIDTKNAARDALLSGLLGAFARITAVPAPSVPLRLRAMPSFHGRIDLFAVGMIRIRLGHIMIAALISAYQNIVRRIRK